MLRDHSSAEKFINSTAVLDEEISSPLFVVGLALHMFAVGSVGGGFTMERSCHSLFTMFVSLIVIGSC